MNPPENLETYAAFVRAEGKASTSFLREKFNMGYSRADKIMRQLEKAGVVSKASKTGQRKILEPKLEKLTNAESAIVLRKEAGCAEVETIQSEYAEFEKATKALGENTISTANLARSIGIRLQTFNAGKKQIDLHFWKEKCAGVLPFDFDTGKLFVSVANKMEHPAKTVTEAVQFVQMALIAAGSLELEGRGGQQIRSDVSVLEKFFAAARSPLVWFNKALGERPMENWSKASIETFLSETEWLSVARDKAAKLQAQKYREL